MSEVQEVKHIEFEYLAKVPRKSAYSMIQVILLDNMFGSIVDKQCETSSYFFQYASLKVNRATLILRLLS